MNDMCHNLLWGVRRSIRYHSRRRSFYERFNLLTNAVALIFGSASILTIFKLSGPPDIYTLLPPAIVTVFSAFNLVIGTTRMAQLHHDLLRRFIDLEQEIVQADEHKLQEFEAKRLKIEADEPPILRILDILCHNELMKAKGYDPASYRNDYYQVGPIRRLFSQFFDINPDGVKCINLPKSSPTC